MHTFTETIPISCKAQLPKKYLSEDALFFDIETTGLAPSSYVFLIGCGHFVGNSLVLTQWLMDTPSDEVLLINSFFEYASCFKRLIHYNGTTFDIPFLQKRCRFHGLSEQVFRLASSDVYKSICKHKRLINATDYRLKTLEELVGFMRRDVLDGIQLVDTFISYIGRKGFEELCLQNKIAPSRAMLTNTKSELPSIPCESSEDICKRLLLHNKEDLLGLLNVCTLLSIERLLSGDFTIDAHVYAEDSLLLRLKTAYPLFDLSAVAFDDWAIEKHQNFIYLEVSSSRLLSYFGEAPDFSSKELLLYDLALNLLSSL